MPKPPLRAYFIGFLAPLSASLTIAAAAVHGPGAGPWAHVTRFLDSFAVHLLALSFALALLVFALRARWVAALLIALILAVGVPLARTHIALTQPVASAMPSNLRVLWFNILSENPISVEHLSTQLTEANADIIVLGEAARFRETPEILTQNYPHKLGCEIHCELLIHSRYPIADTKITDLSPLFHERLATAQVSLGPDLAFTLSVAHMGKPWYVGVTEREDHKLDHHIEQQTGPHVLIGDFNAAPWSHRIKRRTHWNDLRGVRVPVSTWPVPLGRFGLPIDQVFVGGGVQVTAITPWGRDLGSNHLGLLVDLHIPDGDAQ